jgi:hypothetical protein
VQSTGRRTVPDVSFLADPATGVWIADAFNLPLGNPWEITGGTSLAAPSWAALIALVNQGRAAAGKETLGSSGPAEAQRALYNLPQADYHVIASGNNGAFTAQPGYNLVTGLGTPIANRLIPDLIAWSAGITALGNTAPAWQGSSSYQKGSPRGVNGSPDSITAANGVGDPDGLRSMTNAYAGQGALPPARATSSSGATAAKTEAVPANVSTLAAMGLGATVLAGREASLSVFSQTGPLVLERWSASSFVPMSRSELLDPQGDGYTRQTPGLDGDDGVLVGGTGNDLIIGDAGRNLMVGGFGFDQVAEDRAESVQHDTAAVLAPETAGRDGVLWSTLTGRSVEVFTDVAETVVLDQLFGSAELDVETRS